MQARFGKFEPAGYFYLTLTGLFWAVVAVYVVRSFAISKWLERMVPQFTVKVQPFHADRCGGLHPVGRLGLRNQYMLMIIGLNLSLMLVTALVYFPPKAITTWMCIVPAALYVVCGPIVFVGPLLPFREPMKQARDELRAKVSQSRQALIAQLTDNLHHRTSTAGDVEMLARQHKLEEVIDEVPVWPFDLKIRRKFVLSYVMPLLGLCGLQALTLAKKMFEILLR